MLFGPFECGPVKKTRGESLIRRSLGSPSTWDWEDGRSQSRDEAHQKRDRDEAVEAAVGDGLQRGAALKTTDCDVERRKKGKELEPDSQQRRKRGIIIGGERTQST